MPDYPIPKPRKVRFKIDESSDHEEEKNIPTKPVFSTEDRDTLRIATRGKNSRLKKSIHNTSYKIYKMKII